MPNILRWGLLSTARINHHILPALRASKRNQLVAVASRSAKKARQYAGQWKIPRAYGSYEELLDDPEIDVIYIPLPNDLHVEWALKAARAGKHVLCEKPIALSLEQMDALIAAAELHRVHIAEAFQYRHHPQTLKVKELLDAGEIGELRYLHGSFSFPLDRPDDIRWNPAQGGGSLWDVGCYPLSYAILAAGAAPLEVMGWQRLSASGVDASFVGQMRFAGGMLAHIQCSFEEHDYRSMDIHGASGILAIPDFLQGKNGASFSLLKEQEKTFRFKGIEFFEGEVENMADVILEHQPARLTLAESRQIVHSLTALYESARTGKPVTL